MTPSVRVVGHPFGPLGISRVARCSFASFQAVGMDVQVMDVWRGSAPDPIHGRLLAPYLTREFGDFNLFHVNGDEVEPVLEKLGGLPGNARNAIYPMWELPRYPDVWARQLERFDEVWAGSRFIADAIAPTLSKPVVHMPLPTQVDPLITRSRRYFGIPEEQYVFLFFLDLRSYVERKNPGALIEAFRRFLESRPWAQACLVVKVHGAENAPGAAADLLNRVRALSPRVLLIDRLMDENEVHSLVHNCDAFVSLHRAEGYGLGLAEAMYLGKPVIATGYSGNVDFMNPDVARLIRYQLIPVAEGAYPHWEGQSWAEPDVEDAAQAMVSLYDDPDAGRELGRKARAHMQAHFSFRAAGLRYLARVESTTS